MQGSVCQFQPFKRHFASNGRVQSRRRCVQVQTVRSETGIIVVPFFIVLLLFIRKCHAFSRLRPPVCSMAAPYRKATGGRLYRMNTSLASFCFCRAFQKPPVALNIAASDELAHVGLRMFPPSKSVSPGEESLSNTDHRSRPTRGTTNPQRI
jgi:hypothetical protein